MRRWRGWSDDQEVTLRNSWLAGEPISDIATKVGRNKHAVVVKAQRMALPLYEPAPVEPALLPFEELDTVPLPKLQRKMMAALLEAHPYGVTCKRLGAIIFDDHFINDPKEGAEALVRRLRTSLSQYGWTAGTTGDRKGIKLFPRRNP